ncbi:MAG: substrate-binding domain-containing protein [Patescibacteria group bacterium]|nr:substrate-binding domain-containing protein [Patescibacteria group bacterium]
MQPSRVPNIAVLINTSTGWGQRLIRGIIQYAQQQGPWSLWIEPSTFQPEVHVPDGWRGDGIIARVATQRMARHIRSTGLPCVNISAIDVPGATFPRVMPDFRKLARIAAEHLLNRGFRNFAYYGPRHRSLVRAHYEGFAEALRDAQRVCIPYRSGRGQAGLSPWLARHTDLIRWVRELPKPIAVLTWFVECGRDIIDACRDAGILVPEEVAVLASDDDPLLCNACLPPLSGITSSSDQSGYQAAALLDGLLHGKRPPKRPVLIEPTSVVSRRSTDTLAIDNADLAQAISYLRTHAAEPLRVTDVLRLFPFSRRQLEQEFRRVLGRSPAQEIRRVRLERAKQLLAETDLPIPAVAASSGFNSPEHFARTFKAHFGRSPLKYRGTTRRHMWQEEVAKP